MCSFTRLPVQFDEKRGLNNLPIDTSRVACNIMSFFSLFWLKSDPLNRRFCATRQDAEILHSGPYCTAVDWWPLPVPGGKY